ncbi:MAG: hypothetical protein IJY78_00240 [Bacteroidaceae bacterium]|nr:hypothetical protein [Bacteroidaceae bacterium]
MKSLLLIIALLSYNTVMYGNILGSNEIISFDHELNDKNMQQNNVNGVDMYISSFDIRQGDTLKVGVKLDIPVSMGQLTAFQFDLYLPHGIKILKNSDGEDIIELSKMSDSQKHILSCSKQKNGTIRFLCYSLSNKVFDGNKGDIMFITLCADSNLTKSDYKGYMKNILLVKPDTKTFTPVDKAFVIKCK